MKIDVQTDGTKVTVTATMEFDTANPDSLPLSDTKLSRSVASTRGNNPVPGAPENFRLGINAYLVTTEEERRAWQVGRFAPKKRKGED